MSDDATPIDTASVDTGGAEGVVANPFDGILADFRRWLDDAKPDDAVPPPAPLDVATVVQQFVALRQEVNLQTKATRTQQEQAAQALGLLQQAMDAVKQREAQAQETARNAVDDAIRPLLKALIDAHDAMTLAQRGLERIEQQSDPPPTEAPAILPMVTGSALEIPPPPALKIWVPYWARWLGLSELIERQVEPMRKWHAGLKTLGVTLPAPSPAPADSGIDEYAERLQQTIETLLVGYRMSLQRLERAMTQFGLETIQCAGEPFDPETMEVAEVVREEGREKTEVLDVVRPGYRWRNRLFRYAQVRVAKG